MPNMFGGDQHHPSYDSRTKLGENEVMVGNTLCRVEGDVVHYEEVNGDRRTGALSKAPTKVRKKFPAP